jgi:hypothetical protein
MNGFGAGGPVDYIADYLKSGAKQILSDKGVKARIVSEAVESVTGVSPVVDASDPTVTWVRLRPEHGQFVDSVFLKGVKQITAGPSKGKPADLKIDVMPALSPVLLKRVLPVAILLGAVVFGAGYYAGRR